MYNCIFGHASRSASASFRHAQAKLLGLAKDREQEEQFAHLPTRAKTRARGMSLARKLLKLKSCILAVCKTMAAPTAPTVWGVTDTKDRRMHGTNSFLEWPCGASDRTPGGRSSSQAYYTKSEPPTAKPKRCVLYAILEQMDSSVQDDCAFLADSAPRAALKSGPAILVSPVDAAAAAVQTRSHMQPPPARRLPKHPTDQSDKHAEKCQGLPF